MNRLLNILYKKRINLLIYRLVIIAVLLFGIGISFGSIEIAYTSVFEKSMSGPMRLALPVLLAGGIVLFIMLLFRWYDHLTKKGMMIIAVILFGVMAVIFGVLLCCLHPVPTTDPLHLTNKALEIIDTGEIPISPGQYFERYKNNYFLTICFVCFFKFLFRLGINDVWFPLNLVSTFGILLSTLFTFLIAVRTGGMRSAIKVMTLCVLNPVYYLLAFWTYSASFGMPLIMGVLYFGVCIWQSRTVGQEIRYCIAEAVFAVLGYFIRPTSDIPLIALIVCMGMFSIKRRNIKRMLRCILLCCIVGAVLFKGISAINHQYFSSVEAGNFPIGHWLMTASHGTGRCNSKDDAYTDSFETKEEKSSATLQKAIQNYKKLGISEFLKFEYDKMVITWAHGDAKLGNRVAQDRNIGRLYAWIAGEKDDLLRLYCQAFRIATLWMIVAACVSLLRSNHINKYVFLYALSLFGGILFYCFWEVKEEYSLPFVFIMLLIAEYGGNVLKDHTDTIASKLCSCRQKIIVVSGFTGLMFLCVFIYHGLAVEEFSQKDYSIRSVSTLTRGAVDSGETEEIIEQEFYASKAFNKIRLYVTATGDGICVYQAILMDESGNELYSGEISSKGIDGSEYVKLSTGKISPEGKQKYILKLIRTKESEGKLLFSYRCTPYVDMYDGVCRVNDNESPYDLLLQVYYEQNKSFCSKRVGLLISSGMYIFVLLMYMWFYNIYRKKHKMAGK